MWLIVTKYLIPKGYRGLTVFPLIFIKNENDKENKVLINHEKIHLRQQLELLIFPFFIWYFLEFLIRWVQYKNIKKAYFNISFEREAYRNESNLEYLNNRPIYNWHNFISI
ncbi:MAG TPA: hypothetical protein VN192_00310 [Flavobacterium sp.]|nr:hypothetical protein [Flavobacterium sp.]